MFRSPKLTVPADYKVGDVGTVLQDDSQCPFVAFDRLAGRYVLLEEQLELIQPEKSMKTQFGFTVGDRVRVKEKEVFSSGVKIGDLGTITGFWSSGVEVTVDGLPGVKGVFPHRLEKVAPPFKVGDKVTTNEEISTGLQKARGLVGVVSAAERSSACVDFPGWHGGHDGLRYDDSDSSWWISYKDLKLAPAETAFKVGDRVVVADNYPCPQYGPPKGTFGYIAGICDSSQWFAVSFPAWLGGHTCGDFNLGKQGRWFAPEHLKAAPALRECSVVRDGTSGWKPSTFIVVSDEGPSSRPFKHPSRGAAEAEASRLALKVPGMNFTVYEAVSVAKAEKPEAKVEILKAA